MPIYEYQCGACGHEAEVFQRLSDEDETLCPECQSAEWRRLISAAGFRLKGGGWYETDFKSGNKRNVAGDDADKPKAGSGDKPKATDGDSKAPTSTNKPAGNGGSGNKAA